MSSSDDNPILCRMLTASGEFLEGGLDLLERWDADSDSRLWIDIRRAPGPEEVDLLRSFGCHELAILDAHRTRHPPKIEFFEDHTFILFKGITGFDSKLEFEHLQIALFVGERFLISRHNARSYSIDHWLFNTQLPKVLENPAELAINILHFSAGKYLQQMLEFEDDLSDIEDLMQSRPDDDVLRELTLYKTRLRRLRRVFDYHQKLTANLLHTHSTPFPRDDDELRHQAQDLFERCERLHSLSSMYYEICGDLIDGYLSLSSHQLNQTMRILTVITAVFVPLSFIAGLYGMNFEYMPELRYRFAYFIALGVMLATATGLLLLFRRKRWL